METKEAIRQIALSLPGVAESVSYGTPSFKLKDKMLARLHEDGQCLVLKMDVETRDFFLQANPETYYITDHYRGYPYVLVRLAGVDLDELRSHFRKLWTEHAPKKLLRQFSSDGESNGA
ncbi:MmcQ/YjbR family DNA-binding protein [Paenibacillus aurantiacus]|uniref:MmcQ/YjbR family DNA-binding protein n=1 Tax=Paenibacillus aurantiacus TaxID=1936118 RepID=A0ABV5KME1_9BACL